MAETAHIDPAADPALREASHRLRTPLNAIIGFSQLMRAEIYGPLGAEQYREYVELIEDSGRRLLAQIDELVRSGRLSAETPADEA